jgi:predicted membrane channel-forming protein YqfA (hemolysin III family)
MNNPFALLLAFAAAGFMIWLVLRPLARTVRASGFLRLFWFVLMVLLTLLGLAGLLGGDKKLLP